MATHICHGVERIYVTVSGKRERHYVCVCGLLLAVIR